MTQAETFISIFLFLLFLLAVGVFIFVVYAIRNGIYPESLIRNIDQQAPTPTTNPRENNPET